MLDREDVDGLVASHAEAWIETNHLLRNDYDSSGRLSRGGVDRNMGKREALTLSRSPLTRRRGSKRLMLVNSLNSSRRLSRGGVDRNSVVSY